MNINGCNGKTPVNKRILDAILSEYILIKKIEKKIRLS